MITWVGRNPRQKVRCEAGFHDGARRYKEFGQFGIFGRSEGVTDPNGLALFHSPSDVVSAAKLTSMYRHLQAKVFPDTPEELCRVRRGRDTLIPCQVDANEACVVLVLLQRVVEFGQIRLRCSPPLKTD